jgi:hypothetical protein
MSGNACADPLSATRMEPSASMRASGWPGQSRREPGGRRPSEPPGPDRSRPFRFIGAGDISAPARQVRLVARPAMALWLPAAALVAGSVGARVPDGRGSGSDAFGGS